MAETGTMRVVPSGKIYRQMFEAQVFEKKFFFILYSASFCLYFFVAPVFLPTLSSLFSVSALLASCCHFFTVNVMFLSFLSVSFSLLHC